MEADLTDVILWD